MKKELYASIGDLLENELLADDDPHTAELIQQLAPVKARGYFTQPEFLEMCKWKSPRPLRWYRQNTASHIEDVARAALSSPDERRKVELLDGLSGAGIPTASAIVTLIDPQQYGVIDIRAWQILYRHGAVFMNPEGRDFALDDWDNYLSLLRRFARQFGTSARLVEWTLFVCHRKTQQGSLYGTKPRATNNRIRARAPGRNHKIPR